VSLTVRVGKRIGASGTVAPDRSGERVAVTLLRRKQGSFEVWAREHPRLGRRSGYSTSFAIPRARRCRVVVVVPPAPGLTGSRARRTFSC
jgi:hypothetical protein